MSMHPTLSVASSSSRRRYNAVVELDNAYKHYGIYNRWRLVLRKFSLKAFSGEIYALLGPHGCGKSTALNVVLGLKRLNYGHVTVFGFKPNDKRSGIPGVRLGYTPQCLGLYEEFTIMETMKYYSALLKLNHEYADDRISFLQSLLRLPSHDIRIRYCSEGMKRQISFAIALLHEPELLILDEPTAGVDPVVRQDIWDHLKTIINKTDKAILVTTDSPLDAMNANRMGIIRNGYNLMQDSPTQLLSKYKEKNLETLYKKIYELTYGWELKSSASIEENPSIRVEILSMVGSEGFLYTENEQDRVPPAARTRQKTPLMEHIYVTANTVMTTCLCVNGKRLGIVILRDIFRILRNYIWLLMVLLIPAIFMLIFGYSVGTTPMSLRMGVVNYETDNCASESYTSCQIMRLVDRSIVDVEYFDSERQAFAAAKNLEVNGVLTVGNHFSEKIDRDLSHEILEYEDIDQTEERADDVDMRIFRMDLYLDVTSAIVANTVKNYLESALDTYIANSSRRISIQKTSAYYPLKIRKAIYGRLATSDKEYMLPGLAVTIAYYMAAFISVITLINDRVEKLTDRDYLAGVRFVETIISQIIVYGLITFIEMVLIFLVLFFIMRMPNEGSFFGVILIVIMQIWCGLCFGVLVSTCFRSAIGGGTCVFCFLIITFLLCGVLWPLEGLPLWLQYIMLCFPQTYASFSLRNLMQRGMSLLHYKVWLGILIPFCWLIVYNFICAVINKVSY